MAATNSLRARRYYAAPAFVYRSVGRRAQRVALPMPRPLSTLRAVFFRFLCALTLLAAAVPRVQAQYFSYGKNKVQYEKQDWRVVRSEHFDVYYAEGGYYLADFAAKAAEEAYASLAGLFQHDIDGRVPLLVYQSHNAFAVTNAVDLPEDAEGIGGVTELFKNRVAIPFTGDYRTFRHVLHHELVHAFVNDFFYGGSLQSVIRNNIRLQIPLWFNEGLAEYAALGWDTESDLWVRDAVLENSLPPISYLGGYMAYRGGQSVFDYLAEQYGPDKVRELLQAVRGARRFEDAFRVTTGLGLDELSDQWQAALREVYFPELAAREKVEEIARPLARRSRRAGYTAAPALSPQGDRVAFIAAQGGRFNVYVARTSDGEVEAEVAEGQNNTDFESLRILSPGLTWSPDGTRLAVAAKSGPTDAIVVVDVQAGKTRRYPIPQVDQVVSVAWSPEGSRIAFAGSRDAQGDLYLLSLAGGAVTALTNDVFSDHAPAWSRDGQYLYFHSDRGDSLAVTQHTAQSFDMSGHSSTYSLYRLPLGGTVAERLTRPAAWDDTNAQPAPDGTRVLFLSDRNGVPNLFEQNLTTGEARPLTDVLTGITQVSLSADGSRAVLLALQDGVPALYLLQDPFERTPAAPLRPNVWAQRRAAQPQAPPTLAVAAEGLATRNPLLRDAADGVPYRPPFRTTPLDTADQRILLALADSLVLPPPADTTEYGGVRVDFRDYVFGEAFDEGAREAQGPDYDRDEARRRPRDLVGPDGRYRSRRYRLSFSPDLVYGTAAYDALYGVQGVTQLLFSDVLGNHQFFVATNLLIDLRNSDYVLSYTYRPGRLDWRVQGFHVSRLLPDDVASERIYRYRQYGGGVAVSYPFDKFRRVDAEVSAVGVSQANVFDAAEPPLTRTLLYPSVTFTRDVTTPGYLYPTDGSRIALSVSGSPASLAGGPARFVTVLFDARAYTSLAGGQYTFALRASGAASVGPAPQLFYTAGVQNWLTPRFDSENRFPITDLTDFAFATPVLPLRGYKLNAENGSYFGLVNAEWRFPLVAALIPGPLPLFPLYNIQGTAFADAGALWGGRSTDRRFNLTTVGEDGKRRLDDLRVGSGFGLRTIAFGFPVRLDFAWPFDGRTFGKRRTYLSVGLDF